MKRAIIVVLAAMASGCVTTELRPGADQVRVTTNADTVRGCESLGNIKASDRMNGGVFGQDAAEENTDRRLRNQAVALGGNVVFLDRASTGLDGSSARGEVYRCPPPKN